jgi:DNA invertase Pin-like site-specific DNA recombinase
MCRVYGYVRGSTNEQQHTLDAQKDTISREFDYRFKDKTEYIWGGFYIDKGVSARIHFRRRPEAGKCILALEKGDVLIISKLDRGFRNMMDLADCLDHFTKQGIRFILCDMGLDPLSLMGRMIVGVLVVVAEFERGMISLRTKEALAVRVRRGLPHDGKLVAGYGFKRIGTKQNQKIVPDPYTRQFGKMFLDWYEQGWSHDRIYFHCLRERLKQRKGMEWSRRRIEDAINGERKLRALEALPPRPLPIINPERNGETKE